MRKRQHYKEMVMNGSTGTFKIPNQAELIDFQRTHRFNDKIDQISR